MDFTRLTIKERADLCQHIYYDQGNGISQGRAKCSNNFNENARCGYICCGHCERYGQCETEKCRQVWVDPCQFTVDPRGRLYYVYLETGQLVSGTVPCLISEMYDDNE